MCQHGHHNVSMCGSLVAEFAMSTWLLWSSVLHYITLVVWCLYAQPTIFILDQFNNQSRADTDCLMKIHSLQNPSNHPWMINLKSYVKEIPAFFSYRRKNIYCIISSFLISCIPTWLISRSKRNWLATTLMIDLFHVIRLRGSSALVSDNKLNIFRFWTVDWTTHLKIQPCVRIMWWSFF